MVTDQPNYFWDDLDSFWPTGHALMGAAVQAALPLAAYVSTGPTATGVAATDTTALQNAINAVPSGGTLLLPANQHYKINAALTINAPMTLAGSGVGATFGSVVGGGNSSNPTGLVGTVIEQTVAATDCLDIICSGQSVNLRDFGIIFTSGLASTGHGVNATTTTLYLGNPDLGVESYRWDNVQVFGHDGNHYAFVRTNALLGTTTGLRSYGGGGYRTVGNHKGTNCGNDVNVHPYAAMTNTGTASGFSNEDNTFSASTGGLNLITFSRPQAMNGTATTTQYVWDDLAGTGVPTNITATAPDLESASAPIRAGHGTVFVNPYVTGTDFGGGLGGVQNMPFQMGSLNAMALALGSAFISPFAINLATFNFGNGQMTLAPVFINQTVTLKSIGQEVTVAGSAGAVLRFGLYNSNPLSGRPQSLVLDAGTAVATSTGAIQVTGLSTVLQPGLYWVAAVPQGAPATTPTTRYIAQGGLPTIWNAFPTGSNAPSSDYPVVFGVTGALPASPAFGYSSNSPPFAVLGF